MTVLILVARVSWPDIVDNMNTRATVQMSRVHRIRLCAESTVDERTVSACYAGRSVRPSSLARIVEAARRLGLPMPPRADEYLAHVA